MSAEYPVCCTGKGTHGKITFPSLVREDDGSVHERRLRKAPAPWPRDARLDTGEALPPWTTTIIDPHLTFFRGSERWEWSCPKCHPWRLNGRNLRAWMDVAETRGSRVLDLSNLRR